MAIIALIGSAGVGATWGWLLGMTEGNSRRPVKSVFVLILATSLIAGEILVLGGRKEVIAFFMATFLTLLLHIAWRRELRFHLNRN